MIWVADLAVSIGVYLEDGTAGLRLPPALSKNPTVVKGSLISLSQLWETLGTRTR